VAVTHSIPHTCGGRRRLLARISMSAQPDEIISVADEATTPPPAPRRSRQGMRALLLRLHFYTGVFLAPFLLVVALTGLAYVFTPQLDDLVYGGKLHVAAVQGQPRPLAEQITAARTAHPEGTLASVITPAEPDDTTRIVLSVPELGDKQRTVFVDPYTATVRGDLTTWWGSTPLTTWLDDLHRNLHLGETGRLYSETAASWLWVLVTGGLILWIGRARGQRAKTVRGVVFPDRTAKGVRRTRGRHAAAGVWLAFGLLFLSATGMTWSHYAGDRFGQLLDAAHAHAPDLDTALPTAPATPQTSGHHTTTTTSTDALPVTFDTVLAAARNAGLNGSLTLTPGEDATQAWSAAQGDNSWPVHYDQVAVDPATGQITAHNRWADYPLPAKLSKLGVQGHMGRLFGLANQLLLAAIAIGLTLVIIWGYRMWWQRRPTRDGQRALTGRAPARGTWRQLPLPALIIGIPAVLALGWALPVLGVTLLAFLTLDLLIGLSRRRRV
jgi:uncharacterized iron-regulated membrane protein